MQYANNASLAFLLSAFLHTTFPSQSPHHHPFYSFLIYSYFYSVSFLFLPHSPPPCCASLPCLSHMHSPGGAAAAGILDYPFGLGGVPTVCRVQYRLHSRFIPRLSPFVHFLLLLPLLLPSYPWREILTPSLSFAGTRYVPFVVFLFPVNQTKYIIPSLSSQTVRKDFIVPVSKERRELVGNVILYFHMLASAFTLKAPLPPYLPPAEKSRQELVRVWLIT